MFFVCDAALAWAGAQPHIIITGFNTFTVYSLTYKDIKTNSSTFYVTSCNVIWNLPPAHFKNFNAFAFLHFIVDCWFAQNRLAFQWGTGNCYCYFHLIIDLRFHSKNQVHMPLNWTLPFLLFDCEYLVENSKWIFNANTIISNSNSTIIGKANVSLFELFETMVRESKLMQITSIVHKYQSKSHNYNVIVLEFYVSFGWVWKYNL